MSVGGRVVETIVLPDKVWVNTEEPGYQAAGGFWVRGGSRCAIYVERSPEARAISEGDSLWWQGQWAMWTPRATHPNDPPFSDRKIRRIGFSGVPRPSSSPEENER